MNAQEIYDGSDGEATKALYARLACCAAVGDVAVNLFRAQKASTRAKVYRGGVRGQGSYKSLAYARKEWALTNLCTALAQHAPALGIRYGWQLDDGTPGYPWVLYVDLPTGQVSFHAPKRGLGPDYGGTWDGVREVSADRIVRFVQALLDEPSETIAQTVAAGPITPTGQLWCATCKCWWTNRLRCLVCLTPVVGRFSSAGVCCVGAAFVVAVRPRALCAFKRPLTVATGFLHAVILPLTYSVTR